MFNSTVSKIIEVTPELRIVQIRPDQPIKPYYPGQYVALGLPGAAPRMAGLPAEISPPEPEKLIKRAYSLSSSPQCTDFLEVYIAVVPQGALTARLGALKEGDRIFAAPKIVGTFTLVDLPPQKNLILVATGTGLAPYVSMVRTNSTWDRFSKVTIIHGVRYESDLGYREELLAMGRERPNLRYLPLVSRAASEWQGERGHVQRLFQDEIVSADSTSDHVFLCGNPAMVDDTVALLVSRGFSEHSRKSPGTLHLERYW